jgi:hypothetical protein
VNSYTTGHQSNPAVAQDAAGDFVVVWTTQQPAFLSAIRGQRYDSGGVPVGGELQVNTYPGMTASPDVAMDSAGNMVAVWDSLDNREPGYRGVYGQLFDSNGAALSGEFHVNTYTTSARCTHRQCRCLR